MQFVPQSKDFPTRLSFFVGPLAAVRKLKVSFCHVECEVLQEVQPANAAVLYLLLPRNERRPTED